jgi:Leucine-rich repeat (LRR) protein
MSLQTLNLSDNNIDDAGVSALVEHALGKAGCLESLRSLDLSDNHIGDASVSALAEHALGKAGCVESLQTLDLRCNPFSIGMLHRIDSLMAAHRAFQRCDVAGSAAWDAPVSAVTFFSTRMRLWRKASKTHRKAIPWARRQRSHDLGHRARLQHTTHAVCEELLIGGDRAKLETQELPEDWRSGNVSVLRRHGGWSSVEAGRLVLDSETSVLLKRLEACE